MACRVCRRLREANDVTPVLLLTARDEIADRISGLDAGADDYIVKPVDVGELLARIRSAMRRSGMHQTTTVSFGDVVLDVRAREARHGVRRLTLTTREFDLLEYLVRYAGVALRRERIEEAVWWGTSFEISSNVVDVFVLRLRHKLNAGAAESIETLRGYGYRLTSRSAVTQ